MAKDGDIRRRDVLFGAGALAGTAALQGCGGGTPSGDDPADSGAAADPFYVGRDDGDPSTVTKRPWVFLQGGGDAVVRFETLEPRPLDVRLRAKDEGGEGISVTSSVSTASLTYSRDTFDIEDTVPDAPGDHTVHDATFPGLEAGVVYEWVAETGGGSTSTGTFRHRVDPGQPFRFGWIADTMWPQTDANGRGLATRGADVVVHGGDIQYQDSPLDTWNRFWQALEPVFANSLYHQCIGNHEFDVDEEAVEMFDRLFPGQGDAGETRWHAFSYGAVRFILLDSETDGLGRTDTPMWTWFLAQLDAAEADDAIATIVVGFHRPPYTLSKHWSSNDAVRDNLSTAFDGRTKVRLVLCGHVHAFEHFEIGGIHWVCEGSGGALQYDADVKADVVAETHPEVVAARKIGDDDGYGHVCVDVDASGGLTLKRWIGEADEPMYDVVLG